MSQLPWVSTVNVMSSDQLATDLIFCKTWQMSHVFDFSVHNLVIVCNWDWKLVHWSLEVAHCQWQIFHSVENVKSRKILLQKAVVLHRHLMHPGWSCCKHSEEHSLCLPLLCTTYMSFMWMSGPTWITKANRGRIWQLGWERETDKTHDATGLGDLLVTSSSIWKQSSNNNLQISP